MSRTEAHVTPTRARDVRTTCGAAGQAGRQRGVLAARALAVVVVADDHPSQAARAIGPRDVGDAAARAGERVERGAGRAAGRVDRAGQQVVAEALEVAAQAQPR